MSTADVSSRATSEKDDQEELFAVESGDEGSHLTDDDEASERGGPSHRRSKRARKATSKSNAPRKKYVKGKQGALQGIMKMPIEVFTEIAYHITPADLTTLVRTNKFFRAMLLRRSSILIWQRAQSNIPELPPCPTGMSEPQYAALMFSKFCTLCGASALAKPDPWLRVRLCASCRDTKLQEITWPHETGYDLVPTSDRINQTKSSRRRGKILTFCIHEELEQVRRLQDEFQKKNDSQGLREWVQERRKKVDTQYEEAEQLSKYIESAMESRAHELGDLKAQRRQQVHERLKALGWDAKYLNFMGGELRQWNLLVDVPKPLTERIWTNLLPKLTPLLEENQSRVDAREKQDRRLGRLEKVQTLVCQFKRDTHPYQSVVDALGITIPAIRAIYSAREVLHIPFPETQTVVKWDFIADIYEEENSLEQVDELFNQRRGQLSGRILKWREEIENQLVKQYKVEGDATGQTKLVDPFVLVQGSTEATQHLSASARFLLRADTVFIRRSLLKLLSPEDQEYAQGFRASHFPTMISTFADGPTSSTYDQTNLKFLDEYVRHVGVEKIAKALLKGMGMPDVAHIELNSKKDAFVCGRCDEFPPTNWENLLAHYQAKMDYWAGGNCKRNNYSTHHPIIIRNIHDLNSESNTKPLVRMASDDERKASKGYGQIKEGTVWCLICSGVGWYDQGARGSLDLMQEHMREMHDVTDGLVLGLHYTNNYSTSWRQSGCLSQWQADWDAHYDAQQASDAVESEPQAEPSSGTETASE